MIRFLILSIFLLLADSLTAQNKDKGNQWWVGLRTGINKTTITPGVEYMVQQPADSKEYLSEETRGSHIGGIVVYNPLPFLSLAFEPNYARYNFGYKNSYEWSSSSDNLIVTNTFNTSLDYLELPVFVRYEYRLDGSSHNGSHHTGPVNKHYQSSHGGGSGILHKTTVFAHVGYQYAKLIGARKRIRSTETFNQNTAEDIEELIEVQQLFNRDLHSVIGGAGISYDIGGSFRMALNANYKVGLNELINGKNRYQDEKLVTKYYDVYDDMKLKSWGFSINFLFPLEFVYSSNYKAL